MNFSEDDVLDVLTRYPDDISLDGACLEVLGAALREFEALSKGQWSLSNYTMSINVGSEGRVIAVSLMPNPAYEINGVPFEIASRGMYLHGRGVTYVYAIETRQLVKTVYMR
ncbi:hypothetical protein WI73_23100 [Burkholderia ubonensis]|uniref:Uncharacterized protein n=1 Tax=Burkholderia ubonensis TaxID=101571 RepID=A0A1R1J7Z7_9BURK|nr:hypothetical protein [Burkholderia ubonensis]AYZ67154.1 hypothetical protein EGY31_29050 [Burkholderia multivorans]KUZ74200.1 hypothetical protein WI37_20815 [Burkholderia ubonensis]KUZ97046.1 hypothetical protein WI40_16110 [Burkholderia ubonensis]KVA08867.1 hypothetical protein WI42_24415 [Burkholderia ubonensis]KVA26297.1 hypothetical protein WI43_07005 [Burkholderia ubonensis]